MNRTGKTHPNRHSFNRFVGPFGALILATTLTACGKPAPETQLEKAADAFDEALTELDDLDSRIDSTYDLLEDLRAQRREQKKQVRTLEEQVDARATDVAIFRAAQTALLNDSALQDAALAVDVEDSVVTIKGSVSDPEQRRRAISLATNTPGVDRVLSRIRVVEPATVLTEAD